MLYVQGTRYLMKCLWGYCQGPCLTCSRRRLCSNSVLNQFVHLKQKRSLFAHFQRTSVESAKLCWTGKEGLPEGLFKLATLLKTVIRHPLPTTYNKQPRRFIGGNIVDPNLTNSKLGDPHKLREKVPSSQLPNLPQPAKPTQLETALALLKHHRAYYETQLSANFGKRAHLCLQFSQRPQAPQICLASFYTATTTRSLCW